MTGAIATSTSRTVSTSMLTPTARAMREVARQDSGGASIAASAAIRDITKLFSSSRERSKVSMFICKICSKTLGLAFQEAPESFFGTRSALGHLLLPHDTPWGWVRSDCRVAVDQPGTIRDGRDAAAYLTIEGIPRSHGAPPIEPSSPSIQHA